eukprot:4399602-Pleurochrysis_carterae.AAC.1
MAMLRSSPSVRSDCRKVQECDEGRTAGRGSTLNGPSRGGEGQEAGEGKRKRATASAAAERGEGDEARFAVGRSTASGVPCSGDDETAACEKALRTSPPAKRRTLPPGG